MRFCLFAIFLVHLLAGCGGTEAPPSSVTVPPPSFTALGQQSSTLESIWGTTPALNVTALPISGQASYDGVLLLTVQNGSDVQEMAGKLVMTADFANLVIGGSASDFVDEFERLYVGQLQMQNGAINPAAVTAVDPSFHADLTGGLQSGAFQFYIVADLYGDFLGMNADAVRGPVSGSATSAQGGGFVLGSYIAQ